MRASQRHSAEGTHPALGKFLELTVPLFKKGGEDLSLSVRKAEEALANDFASLVMQERALAFHGTEKGVVVAKIAAECEALCRNPRIREVRVHRISRSVQVKTETLLCRIPGDNSLFEIGEMDIEIYPSGKNFGVRVQNLTRRVNGGERQMHAPLIGSDGRCLSAQLLSALPALIGRHEYHQIVTLVIQSIERLDPTHPWSTHVTLWPRAGEEGKQK